MSTPANNQGTSDEVFTRSVLAGPGYNQLENDLMRKTRGMVCYTSLNGERRDMLIDSIDKLEQKPAEERTKKLRVLLERRFHDIYDRTQRAVILSLLRKQAHIDTKYLSILADNDELYGYLDIEMKQKVWCVNLPNCQARFDDVVAPLLLSYIRAKESTLYDYKKVGNLFYQSAPKMRRQGDAVQNLVKLIGKNILIFKKMLLSLQMMFLCEDKSHFCTLSTEIILALDDLKLQQLVSIDIWHRFSRCLDASIYNKEVDTKRARELQYFLDNLMHDERHVLGDVSMMLRDPFAIDCLASSALKNLQEVIDIESLPRHNKVLILLLRLLSLGLSARHIIDTQNFREPKADSDLVIKFLPALMGLMVEDQCSLLDAQLDLSKTEQAEAVPDIVKRYIRESAVASMLVMYYALDTARKKNTAGLLRILPVLKHCKAELAYEDPFLHSLTALLIAMAKEFSSEIFCKTIFESFLLWHKNIDLHAQINISRHVLKLLWHVHSHLPAELLAQLMKALPPDLHELLLERIQLYLREQWMSRAPAVQH